MYRLELKLNDMKVVVSALIIVITCTSIVFASTLKKGVYELKNHRIGGSMFINETGEIILKSEPNVEIGTIKDLFTDETSILYKNYAKTYENSHYDEDPDGYIYYEKKYTGLTPEKTVYLDLSGKEIQIDKTIIAVVGENIILDDGTVFNRLLSTTYRLQGISRENEKITYKVDSFDGKVLISETETERENVNNGDRIIDIKANLYVYDESLNFIKKIEGYAIRESSAFFYVGYPYLKSNITNENDYIVIEHVGNHLIYEGYIDEERAEKNIMDKNLTLLLDEMPYDIIVNNGNDLLKFYFKNKQTDICKYYDIDSKSFVNINDSGRRFVDYTYDKDKLETILHDDNDVVLNDIVIKECFKFVLDGHKYYFVNTDLSGQFIYNESGNRVKIITNKEKGKFIYADQNCFMILNNGDEMVQVYNKSFDKVTTFPRGDKKHELQVIKLFNDNYYMINKKIVYDKKFNMIFDLSHRNNKMDYVLNKYLVILGKRAKFYDEKMKLVKELEDDVKTVNAYKIGGKNYLKISGEKFTKILDQNFKEILAYNSNYLSIINIKSIVSQEYEYEGGALVFGKRDKHLLIEHHDAIDILDINMKKIGEIKKEEDQQIFTSIINNKDEEYIVISDDRGYNSSLYKVGTGFVLKDCYFIGDMQDEYFTYANGFYYGIMDYDLNTIYQYSIFDKIDDDYSQYRDEGF